MSSPCPPKGVMFTTKDLLTWKGWSLLNDREIVRLSAELGTHIALAQTFIATRRGWDKEEVERWYKAEVTAWVIQLLSTGEITIATRILENIQIDAVTQLLAIAKEAKDRETIKTIANYLYSCVDSEIGEIHDNIKDFLNHFNLLRTLDLILSHKGQLEISIFGDGTIKKEDMTYQMCTQYTVQDIQKYDKVWKSSIAVYLYFKTFDPTLVLFLDADITWDYLLTANKVQLLKTWIHISFTKSLSSLNENQDVINHEEIFAQWSISEDMISRILTSSCTDLTKEEIYDHLATFGYFNKFERNNIIHFLNRISRNENVSQITILLDKATSNLTLDHFYKMLMEYCEKHQIKTVVTKCINTKLFTKKFLEEVCGNSGSHWLKISRSFLEMIETPNDEKTILDCINITTKYFAGDDTENYLIDNPAIFIAMILFHEENGILSTFINNSDIIIDMIMVHKNTISKIIEKLPHFHYFIHHATNAKLFYTTPDINLYDMLSKYNEVNMSNLLTCLREGTADLDDKHMMSKFGFKAKLNYEYYLKIGSPLLASKAFYLNQLRNYDDILKTEEEKAFSLAYTIALENSANVQIVGSCVSFIEILGMNSNKVRCYASASRYLRNKYLCVDQAEKVNENICIIDHITQKIAKKLLILLENILMKDLKESLTDILAQWKTAISIAIMHQLEFPKTFLITCAKSNKWSWYMIFAQIHNYSEKLIFELSHYFTSHPLREHLVAAWRKNLNCSNLAHLIHDQLLCSDGFWRFLLSTHCELNPCNRLLKACNAKNCNPIFATIAGCYKSDYTINSWYAWLNSAMQYTADHNINEEYSNISIDNISAIIDYSVQEGFVMALNESLHIFFSDNPLSIFSNFLFKTIVEKQFDDNVIELIDLFKNHTVTLHMIPHLNAENVLKDRMWLLNKSIKLCCIAISYAFESDFHKKQFLKCLCEAKLTKNIETNSNFAHMLSVLQCISDTTVDLDVALISLENNRTKEENEYRRCLQKLIDGKYFQKSLEFSKLTQMNTDLAIIAQMRNRCYKLLRDGSTDINIWLDCDKIFHESKLSRETAIDFFLDFASNLESSKFKYILYYLALLWEHSANDLVKNTEDIEKNMWMNYLRVENVHDLKLFHSKYYDETNNLNPLHHTIKELKSKACIDDLAVSEEQLTEEMLSNLNKLISTLLDLGDFITALRVQVMFSFSHTELQLLITIMALAEGSLSPYQMTPAQRMTLMQSKCVRTASGQFGKRTLKSKLSTSSSMSHSPNSSFMSAVFSDYVEIPSREKQDTLCTIEALAARLKAGRFAGERIVMCYRAAMHMDQEYTDIIQNVNMLQMLEEAVRSDCMNKLVVVSDLISASGLTSMEVAEYLAHEIFKSIFHGTNPKSKKDKANLNVILLWGYNLSMDFHLFLELCQEPSHIGTYLLEYISFIQQPPKAIVKRELCIKNYFDKKVIAYNIHSNVSKILKDSKKLTILEINAISVELLICAHDSYTRDCNIEGISLILRRARMLCLQLLQTKCWGLMVKLLTGIARYTEMTYVFEILKSNDQFEYLLSQFNYILGQQDSKKNQLKMALLEFLKTYWPQDSELKRLVALHFQMHSEVAELLQIEAADIIKRMINIALLEMTNHGLTLKELSQDKSPLELPPFALLTNSVDTRDCLNRAMNSYSHSAEYYVQQNKLSLAMKATHEAELVALQIHLLNAASTTTKIPSIKCILQLKPRQISYMINKELNFLQGMILHRAYDYAIDWASALYEHCIVNGDMQYLNNYNRYLEINEAIAQELAMRFQKETQLTRSMIESIRSIIIYVPSIVERYRLASLLGQRDIVENILSSESIGYLKDTVFVGKIS